MAEHSNLNLKSIINIMEGLELNDSDVDKIYNCLVSTVNLKNSNTKEIFGKIDQITPELITQNHIEDSSIDQKDLKPDETKLRNSEIIKWIESNIDPVMLFRLQKQLIENRDIMNMIQEIFFEKMLS
jgi:hypothetical protein